jgi:hypothetical protein
LLEYKTGLDRKNKDKNSSLERDTEGRITINIENDSNPGNPANRKNRIKFFPSSSTVPRRNEEKPEMEMRVPLKGFIGSSYNDAADKPGTVVKLCYTGCARDCDPHRQKY